MALVCKPTEQCSKIVQKQENCRHLQYSDDLNGDLLHCIAFFISYKHKTINYYLIGSLTKTLNLDFNN